MCVAALLLNAGHPGYGFSEKETTPEKDSEAPESLTNETGDEVNPSETGRATSEKAASEKATGDKA